MVTFSHVFRVHHDSQAIRVIHSNGMHFVANPLCRNQVLS